MDFIDAHMTRRLRGQGGPVDDMTVFREKLRMVAWRRPTLSYRSAHDAPEGPTVGLSRLTDIIL